MHQFKLGIDESGAHFLQYSEDVSKLLNMVLLTETLNPNSQVCMKPTQTKDQEH